MKSETNKILIIAIVALFFVATMPLGSATANYIIESKTGGEEVTETFNLCHINSSGYGFAVYIPAGITGKGLLFLSAGYWGLENTTTTIKTLQKTLTIKGEHEVFVGKLKPRIIKFLENFRLPIPRFFGEYKLPQMANYGDISFKGYGIGVEVTYYT